jgi:hypothetical protein
MCLSAVALYVGRRDVHWHQAMTSKKVAGCKGRGMNCTWVADALLKPLWLQDRQA